MEGKLSGVGVGTGDPKLMTLKAAECIRSADLICIPQPAKEKCRAYLIAEQALPEIKEKKCICCDFRMTRDKEELKALHSEIYQQLRQSLEEGKSIAFLTIGDPATYSTFAYILEKAKRDGFETELISGVTSYNAVAASLGITLCEGDEELHIGTAQNSLEDFINLPGTKVIMKSGHSLKDVKDVLLRAERERGSLIYAVSDCGLPEEKKYFSASDIPENGAYMTTIIVKDRKQD